MKQKLPIVLLFLVLLLSRVNSFEKSCKTDLMRSFSIHGRLTPNKYNAVCPAVELNCCTEHDQMEIHKMWTTTYKEQLEKRHNESIASFKKLNRLIKNRDLFNLKELEREFKMQFKPNPRYINHTSEILVNLSNMDEGKLLQRYKGLMDMLDFQMSLGA